ncbi:EKC/KEOPS complex subunit TP53RK-like [Sycon ciliatum]|uniref:EKC/KEOPS complex subunit TP53RK-like n=1 Tax=Sycon ciliatum TaxID=27933 RepID=UPI0020ADD2F8|eukprot:scpid96507/ scgid31163/ TP53-regulating kinase; Nori-2; p53-related protein kinase
MELLQQGAEARLYRTSFCGKPTIVKERFNKAYRHETLDTLLTQRRTNQEVRSLLRCRKAGIACPAVFFIDYEKHRIYLEEIVGAETLRDAFCRLGNGDEAKRLGRMIGRTLASMHDADIIHGDLTTSNMMLRPGNECAGGVSEEGQLFLIDFGLSSVSTVAEDKGVDLYVLERAFLSSHPNSEAVFKEVLSAYRSATKNAKSVVDKLEEVRMRGRKRSMLG